MKSKVLFFILLFGHFSAAHAFRQAPPTPGKCQNPTATNLAAVFGGTKAWTMVKKGTSQPDLDENNKPKSSMTLNFNSPTSSRVLISGQSAPAKVTGAAFDNGDCAKLRVTAQGADGTVYALSFRLSGNKLTVHGCQGFLCQDFQFVPTTDLQVSEAHITTPTGMNANTNVEI